MTLLEWHHAYIGVAALAVAWLVIFFDRPGRRRDRLSWALGLFGLWMVGDDLFQHWRQGNDPDYLSPVNRLWGWLVGLARAGEVVQEAHMEGHPHHWYQWVKEWIVPIGAGLLTIAAGAVGLYLKFRKGPRAGG